MFTNFRLPLRSILVAIAGLAVVASPTPASAGTQPTRPDYVTIRGSGTWTAEAAGGAAVAGVTVWLPHASEPTPADATAGLFPLDGTFPAAGLCEPATATIATSGVGRVTMTLEASGTVCGSFTEDPADVPAQYFTGRYVVTDGAKRFRGDDGFMQVQFFADGGAYLFATDS